MKSKMKTAFAIIAVALMIMVAVVPMASVFMSEDSSATALPVPTPSTTEKGITFSVVDKNGATIPYAKVGTLQTGADGTVKVSWLDARGHTYAPTMNGFTFSDSITINTNVPVDSPDMTRTFKANEVLHIVDVKTATGETVTDGKITYPTGGGTAQVDVYENGNAYVPQKAAVADADMTYALTAGKATKDGVLVSNLTAAASASTSVVAAQSLITVSATDYVGTPINATNATFVPAAVSTVAFEGKVVAAVTIPEGGYKVTNVTAGVYTFPASDYLTVNAYTAQANEKQALIKVNAGSYELTKGNITTTNTGASPGNYNYDPQAGGFAFPIKNDATNIGVTFSVKDDCNQAMAVDALAGKTFDDFNSTVTVTSTDVAYQISGAVKYNDGNTNVKVAGLKVAFKGGDDKYDATTGNFAIIVKEGSNGALVFTPSLFITSIVTSETFTVNDNITYDFFAEQKELVAMKIQLNNRLDANSVIGGSDYEVKLVPSLVGASTVTATWDDTDKVFKASLPRGDVYQVVVTNCTLFGNIANMGTGSLTITNPDKFSLNNANSKGNDYGIKVVLENVTVSGYLYSKWVDGDSNNRPMINGTKFVVYKTQNVTTDQNGFFNGVNVPRGVAFVIYNTQEFGANAEGKYWSISIPAITSGATADVTTEMEKQEFDAYGYVKAYQFGDTEAITVKITAITMQISVNGGAYGAFAGVSVDAQETGRFNLQLNEYQGQKVNLKVTAVTFANADLHITGDNLAACVWENFETGKLDDKVFADEKVYAGTVKSANGYGLTGTLTLTTAPGGVAKNLAVTDGDYVFAVTGAVGVQQLYTVAFKDTPNNVFTVWDGQYGNADQLKMFRASFTPGATPSEDKVVSGTLSTTVAGEFISSQPNANFVTKEYIIAGTVKDSATPAAAVAGQTFDFKWTDSSTTPATTVTYSTTATTAAGAFYYFVGTGSTSFAKLSNSTELTITLKNNLDAWILVTSDKVAMSDADSLEIKLAVKGVTITLKDAYGNNIDGVTAAIYKVNEPTAEATLTFKNGVATYMPAVSGTQYVTKLISLDYTLNEASAVAKPFTIGTVVPLVTNEGKVTGKVVDVSGFDAEIDATLIVTIAAKNYEIEVTDGKYESILPKGNYTHAYLKGGSYALLDGSSGNTTVTDAGVAADLNADSRIIIGVLVDGQIIDEERQAIPDVDVVFTVGGVELDKVTTNELGIFTVALKDDMSVKTYGDVTATVLEGTRDLGYSLNDAADNFVYTAKTTAMHSTFIAELATNENMMVITILDDDDEPIEGLALTAVATIGQQETVKLITDENGQAIVHSARDNVHEYSVSYVTGVIATEKFSNFKYNIGTVLIGGTAYINQANKIVVSDDVIKITKNDELVMVIETDEDGYFLEKFPRLVDWDFQAEYGNLTVNSIVKFKADTHNVDGHYYIPNDYIDFNAQKISIVAGYDVAGADLPEEVIGEALLTSTLGDKYLAIPVLFLDGTFTTYVPAEFADDNTEFYLELIDSPYSTMKDEIEDNILVFVTNEYRMYVSAVYEGKGIDGAVIELSDDGYLFGEPIDASAGRVFLEAVEPGSYIRALADGYTFIAYVNDVPQENNIAEVVDQVIAFVAEKIEVFYHYSVDYGDNIILAKYVDVRADQTMLQLTLLVDNPREEISVDVYDVVNHKNIVKKYEFKGWNVNGKVITEPATSIKFSADPTVLNYLVAPMFDEVTEDVSPALPPEPEQPDKSVDSNLMFAGIAAIIVAIIAVVFAIIKVLFIDGRKDKPKQAKPAEEAKAVEEEAPSQEA